MRYPVSHAQLADEPADPRMAARLRLARKLAGRTLKCVANGAGASESLLSKVENAKAQPSIGMLQRLAATLGRPVSWFFGSEEGIVQVSCAATRAEVPRAGPVERVLSRGALDTMVIHLGEYDRPWTPPDGVGETFAYVLDGSVEVLTSGGVATLASGDAVACHAGTARSFRASGGKASLLVVDADATRSEGTGRG